MPTFSRHDVILVRYPFSDLSSSKVRPAIVVNGSHSSHDLIIVPVTSRITSLLTGEFVLGDWKSAGLNVASAVKRGLYTVEDTLVLKTVGQLTKGDTTHLDEALRMWLELT